MSRNKGEVRNKKKKKQDQRGKLLHCRRWCLVNFHRKQQCKSHKVTPHFFNCTAKFVSQRCATLTCTHEGGKKYITGMSRIYNCHSVQKRTCLCDQQSGERDRAGGYMQEYASREPPDMLEALPVIWWCLMRCHRLRDGEEQGG